MPTQVIVVAVAVFTVFVLVLGMLLLAARFYRRVKANEALVVTTPSGTRVHRNGAVVYPRINTAEIVDLSEKVITITRSGRDALGTKDGARVDIEVTFALHVKETTEDIIRAATKVGAARIADPKALGELFDARLGQAVADVLARFSLASIEADRTRIVDEIMAAARDDPHGFEIAAVTIARIAPAAVEQVGAFR